MEQAPKQEPEQSAPQDTPETPQVSEIEVQASEYGWKPETEFRANPANEGKKWRTAEDFMDRKPLLDKIETYSRKVKDLEKGLNALAQHNQKISEQAYERALADLKAERRAALEEGDLVKAEDLKDRMDMVKQQAAQTKSIIPTAPTNPAFDEWVANNSWYNEDRKARALADGIAQNLVEQGIRNPAEIFATVEREVRETFPNKFRNPRKDAAPFTEAGNKKAPTKEKFELTPEEERIMNTIIRSGAPLSRDDYIKQIRESRGSK
jgi:hypothetical protein